MVQNKWIHIYVYDICICILICNMYMYVYMYMYMYVYIYICDIYIYIYIYISLSLSLINKMNNFTSSRPTLWLKSSRNCSGGWRGLVGGFSYYIKIFYQIYFIKIYIWKRGKLKRAKHRRILMPIWFHSLTILPGSAAGAAALKSGDASPCSVGS